MPLPERPVPMPTRRSVLAGSVFCASLAILKVPPAAAATPHVLRAAPATVRLRGETQPATSLFAYEGTAPGPVLKARRGKAFAVRLENGLDRPTALHWHGVRLANTMDGVPGLTQPVVAPGAAFDYAFTPPDAGTFLYRPAVAAPGAAQGLAGVLVVEEDASPNFDRDVVLALSRWPLDAKGDLAPDGKPHLTANGAPTLDIPVRTNERLRLRLANVTGSDLMAVRIEQHEAFVVAIDGQPAETYPARNGRVVLGPGNRIDLVLDARLAPGSTAAVTVETRDTSALVATLVYEAGARPSARDDVPRLPDNPLPQRIEFRGAQRLDLPLDPAARLARKGAGGTPMWVALGEPTEFGPPLFNAKRGSVVMLALANKSGTPQSVHIHGHAVRLLDSLDDGWKPFWLDTILVLPNQTARVAFVADNPGKWLISCRPLDAQAEPFATWFAVG